MMNIANRSRIVLGRWKISIHHGGGCWRFTLYHRPTNAWQLRCRGQSGRYTACLLAAIHELNYLRSIEVQT